ncbi:hypothetical protein KBI52_03590 [Microvirga sp. HBU67558]|uniref:hypothetical protein n=1 Tax=Microvirga TaxID=186650 RepID=UPI001B38E931|nr:MULTISPECIES: hypothetical protein [unclassified Microvirga]MBQ0819315.1 hypothetical protein [Microvirga sp. HBU67558]
MPDEQFPIRDDKVEAVARAILRETIERSSWYPELRGKRRLEQIDQDVERHWHLMIDEARKRLLQGIRQSQGG